MAYTQPIGSWVDTQTKKDLGEVWNALGFRSEAEYVREAVEKQLRHDMRKLGMKVDDGTHAKRS